MFHRAQLRFVAWEERAPDANVQGAVDGINPLVQAPSDSDHAFMDADQRIPVLGTERADLVDHLAEFRCATQAN